MRPAIITSFIVSSLFGSGCEKENSISNIKSIKYGTSFGECISYCKHDINISEHSISFNKSGWVDTVKSISLTDTFKYEQWDSFTQQIDIKRFNKLDTIIGCPDCADGGAEWIEIETVDSSHKITFEYGNEPAEVKNYIKILRNYLIRFEN